MRFDFEYRTPDNVRHDGTISAPSREAAFAALREKGIRPSRMTESAGFFNKLFGKGKRWSAIAVLAVVACVTSTVAWRDGVTVRAVADSQTYEPRGQLFGDPVLIARISADDWQDLFDNAGDRFLANHAIPGKPCSCRLDELRTRELVASLDCGRDRVLPITPTDLEEVAKIKRKVNWMKRELREYVRDGGTALDYIERVHLRAAAEIATLERVREELRTSDDKNAWTEKNALLRRMGLPMVAVENF